MANSELAGKLAWVTGGGSGIGLAAAQALAREGAHVIISGRREGVLEEACAQVNADVPGGAEAVSLDVADRGAVLAAARAIEARHGAIDVLVNSAGVNVPRRFWADLDPSDFQQVVDINLIGPMATCQAVLPGMRAKRAGLIINVASWAGRYDTALTGPAYNASKHGLVAMTATINMEEGRHGIRACALCPGEVATPILKSRPIPPSEEDLARMLSPEDLGAAIRYVASQPPRVCVNELVISPTWNRIYLGGTDLGPRSRS